MAIIRDDCDRRWDGDHVIGGDRRQAGYRDTSKEMPCGDSRPGRDVSWQFRDQIGVDDHRNETHGKSAEHRKLESVLEKVRGRLLLDLGAQ